MRKLMWFTIGLAAGCAVCAYIGCGSWLWFCAAAMLAASVIIYFLAQEGSGKRIIALLLAGFSVGSIAFILQDVLIHDPARVVDGQKIYTTVEVSAFSHKTNSGISADGYIQIEDHRYKVRVYLSGLDELRPGDTLVGDHTLYYTGSGGIDDLSYLRSNGIYFQVFPDSKVTYKPSENIKAEYYPAYLRHSILDLIDNIFPEDTVAFAKALLLSETSELSVELDTAFRNSGIRHIVAVSGLHVSILFSMIAVVTGRRRWLTTIIGIPVLLLFAAVAGFTPSVTRACIMQCLILLAIALNQEYDPPTALCVAVLVLLLIDPVTITSIGFQLSVSCVAGIFLFYQPIHNFLLRPKWMGGGKGKNLKGKLVRWFAGSVAVSSSAMIFTLPLSAIHFQGICLIGVLSNLLTMWAVSYVFYGVIAACIFGVLWMPLGSFIAGLVSWLMRYVSNVAIVLGEIPFAYIPADNIYIVFWVILLYMLIFLLYFSKKKYVAITVICVLLGFGISVGLTVAEGCADTFRVTVLDVGQGQCVLLQSGDACYMVDCGGTRPRETANSAVRALWNQGVYKLDGIILTHYDKDHVNGLLPLFVQIQADRFYLPDCEDKDKLRPELESAFGGNKISISEVTEIFCGEGKITVIPAFDGARGNESSMCILFQAENCDILITGDRDIRGEEQLLRQIPLPDIEILIVGHHGSADSTGLELLRRTKPEIAVISVGKDNHYGHPEQKTLERLDLFECQIYRTDEQGTIIFRR
jgi:competence protein ComEC